MFVFGFLQMKGAYISRYRMPEDLFVMMSLLGLSHKGAYTSRCQMPKFEQFMKWTYIKKGMAHRLATIQNRSDLCLGILMTRFVMEGMLEWEWEDI